ncbi:hypothetical protein [Treponema zioleckii]|uniref:hypothetical protein n=1 Tax=Treponema zioleckii TaxID=331680 RepID=UPI00168BCBF2|nr:hypothetical protein [Treponema zioleckii]
MKKFFSLIPILIPFSFSLISCASKPRDYSVISSKEWNSVKESRIISLENITLDGENFCKDIILDDNKKPVKNCDCTIYVLFEERLASEDDDWDEGMQRLQKYTKEELETSDKIGRIRAKTNKDGWLYVKGLPYDTCFIFYINNGK